MTEADRTAKLLKRRVLTVVNSVNFHSALLTEDLYIAETVLKNTLLKKAEGKIPAVDVIQAEADSPEATIDQNAKCLKRHVQNVATNAKFPSVLLRVKTLTAAIVLRKKAETHEVAQMDQQNS